MRIERNHRHDKPHISNSVLWLPSEACSIIYIDTEELTVVDYQRGPSDTVDWYFYLGKWRTGWDKITDEQRLIIRTAIWEVVVQNKFEWALYDPGKYTDDRYYILEALVED